jgi:hypothetical protein
MAAVNRRIKPDSERQKALEDLGLMSNVLTQARRPTATESKATGSTGVAMQPAD